MVDQAAENKPYYLRLRRVAIDTYKENVVYLHRQCHVYSVERFQALSKIEIVDGNGHRIVAVLNVVDTEAVVGVDEVGLSEQAFEQMDLAEGSTVAVAHAEPPGSMEAVRRKIAGERLSQADYTHIAQDIAGHRYSKMEMAAFLVSAGQAGLDRDEVLYLTRAMAATGEKLDWHESVVVDKHCIGGIPGNRTSMLVVPIVAAHGMLMPKTSSRAITSPAGTADTMEMLANVELTPEGLNRVVAQERACLAWGGQANLAPVDDILISVERPLLMDSQSQMVASILSKKLAAGSTHLLIDIPVGPSAKVRHMRQALSLRKLFEYVGDHVGLHVEVIITDGRQPIGRGVGPALEARDVIDVLECKPDAPADLRQKALRLAGRVIEFDPDVRGGQGYAIARDILDSGRALDKLHAIIQVQGVRQRPGLGRLTCDVKSSGTGVVTAIDNLFIARLARLTGAPNDKGAGIDLYKKMGDAVQSGDVLYRIYAESQSDFAFAQSFLASGTGYEIGEPIDFPAFFAEA